MAYIIPRLSITTRQLTQQGVSIHVDVLVLGLGESLRVELFDLVKPWDQPA